jgi:ATP synthase protein I
MSTPEKSSKPEESKKSPSSGARGAQGGSGMLGSLVHIERLVQIAVVLPAATFIGWLAGLGLDHWLHLQWMSIAGLMVGALAGFVEVVRAVAKLSKE